jgi:hypothetical protein
MNKQKKERKKERRIPIMCTPSSRASKSPKPQKGGKGKLTIFTEIDWTLSKEKEHSNNFAN